VILGCGLTEPSDDNASERPARNDDNEIRIVGRKDVLEQAVMANGSLVPRGAQFCSLAKRICLNIACAPCICMRLRRTSLIDRSQKSSDSGTSLIDRHQSLVRA